MTWLLAMPAGVLGKDWEEGKIIELSLGKRRRGVYPADSFSLLFLVDGDCREQTPFVLST